MKLSKVSTKVTVFLVALAIIPVVVNFINYPKNTYGGWWSAPIIAAAAYLSLSIFGKGKE